MYKHKQSLYNHKNRGCKGLPEEFIMSVDIIDDDIDKYIDMKINRAVYLSILKKYYLDNRNIKVKDDKLYVFRDKRWQKLNKFGTNTTLDTIDETIVEYLTKHKLNIYTPKVSKKKIREARLDILFKMIRTHQI